MKNILQDNWIIPVQKCNFVNLDETALNMKINSKFCCLETFLAAGSRAT